MTPHVAETFPEVETSSDLPDDVRSELQRALSCLHHAYAGLDQGRDGLLDIDEARAYDLGELTVNVEYAIADLEDVLLHG
jgi:hypothetical protein